MATTFLRRQAVLMNPKAPETEKKVAGLLYNDKADGASSRDLNAIAALTFNDTQAELIFKVVRSCLDPQQNSWQTLAKAVLLLDHLVRFGAERCVDFGWGLLRTIENLQQYNSALIKTSFGTRGGRDNGEPVRQRAKPLFDLLSDDNAIRTERTKHHSQNNAIAPPVGMDDYQQPTGPQTIQSAKDSRAFGSSAGQALAAQFSIEQVPGMYDGRPDRYFDNHNDIRRAAVVEDSHITRNALAGDLLDLDICGDAVSAELPEVHNLAQSAQEQKLQEQLAAQQKQLELLQMQLQGGGQPQPLMPQGQLHTSTQGGLLDMSAPSLPSQPQAQGMDPFLSLSMGAPQPPPAQHSQTSLTSMQGPGLGGPSYGAQPPMQMQSMQGLGMTQSASQPDPMQGFALSQPSSQSMQQPTPQPGGVSQARQDPLQDLSMISGLGVQRPMQGMQAPSSQPMQGLGMQPPSSQPMQGMQTPSSQPMQGLGMQPPSSQPMQGMQAPSSQPMQGLGMQPPSSQPMQGMQTPSSQPMQGLGMQPPSSQPMQGMQTPSSQPMQGLGMQPPSSQPMQGMQTPSSQPMQGLGMQPGLEQQYTASQLAAQQQRLQFLQQQLQMQQQALAQQQPGNNSGGNLLG